MPDRSATPEAARSPRRTAAERWLDVRGGREDGEVQIAQHLRTIRADRTVRGVRRALSLCNRVIARLAAHERDQAEAWIPDEGFVKSVAMTGMTVQKLAETHAKMLAKEQAALGKATEAELERAMASTISSMLDELPIDDLERLLARRRAEQAAAGDVIDVDSLPPIPEPDEPDEPDESEAH